MFGQGAVESHADLSRSTMIAVVVVRSFDNSPIVNAEGADACAPKPNHRLTEFSVPSTEDTDSVLDTSLILAELVSVQAHHPDLCLVIRLESNRDQGHKSAVWS